jgi:pimeloyl-ACP methyl ester carboxylesterase
MKIYILHGWTYQTETWQPLLQLLIARGLDAEILKIPGLTDGTNPVWTLDDYVEWLRQKTSGHERVILIGHSSGGRISIAFAAKYPEKVAHLILEDSAGIPPRGLRALKRNVFRTIAKIGGTITRSESLRTILHKIAREKDYLKATPEMRETMANLVSHDLSKIMDRVVAPTLIIWGAKDTTTPFKDGKLMHEKIQGSKMAVIPDARHSPHVTHAQQVADLILEELKKT